MLVVTGILRRGTHPRYTVGRNRKTHPASYFNIGKVPKGHGALPAGVLVSQGAVGAVEKFLEKGAGETKSGSGSTTTPPPRQRRFWNFGTWNLDHLWKRNSIFFKPPILGVQNVSWLGRVVTCRDLGETSTIPWWDWKIRFISFFGTRGLFSGTMFFSGRVVEN